MLRLVSDYRKLIYHTQILYFDTFDDTGLPVISLALVRIREKADEVYLITRSHEDKATAYLDKIMKILRKEKYLQKRKEQWIYGIFLSVFRLTKK
jgi:hypothetical protein